MNSLMRVTLRDCASPERVSVTTVPTGGRCLSAAAEDRRRHQAGKRERGTQQGDKDDGEPDLDQAMGNLYRRERRVQHHLTERPSLRVGDGRRSDNGTEDDHHEPPQAQKPELTGDVEVQRVRMLLRVCLVPRACQA